MLRYTTRSVRRASGLVLVGHSEIIIRCHLDESSASVGVPPFSFRNLANLGNEKTKL
jgi:hypothetical protein